MSRAATLPDETHRLAAPADDRFYEIVRGERVEKPPMGNIEAVVGSLLAQLIGVHARTNLL